MNNKKIKGILMCVLIILFASVPSAANWSASQTISVEKNLETYYVYTTVINYEAKDWLHITGILDRHSIKGLDGDLSVTAYVPFWKVLYVTSGVRKGLHNSETSFTPYIQATIHF